MTGRELIRLIEAAIEKHGDMQVLVSANGWDYDVASVFRETWAWHRLIPHAPAEAFVIDVVD